ncbi:MAG TPA: hypothetical protein VN310_11685 [Candidatus Dormibacteraeota bacterium]|nr:hypothetical protein [Candidatus Dormibacteraeota bacterium]
MPGLGTFRRALCTLLVLVPGCVCLAGASSATLLLEEPYGHLGFFTATGHAAVYLSGVCAETPLVLRPCAAGELGVVISRYDGVGGYDWVAIPLIPYLYAVERPEDVPLYADPKMVLFLRDQYRRRHLEMVAPDRDSGETPGGNWYELVGSAYDRAAYGFEIETTSAQDLAFIERYNSAPNRSHFHLSYRNCADFAKDVMNFYYPKSLRRSIVADIGITTPKQMAKTLIKYSGRHSELQFTRFVIPQVPGSAARSTPVHGVVESFLKSKKYIVPTAVVNPILAGCVVVVYEGTGAGRFDPARQALVFSAQRELEPPLGAEDRRSYQSELNHLLADPNSELNVARAEKWGRVLRNAAPDLDAEGRPVMWIRLGGEVVSVGVAGSNLFNNDAAGLFTKQLLEARLHAELKRGNPPKASESDITRDWFLLQTAMHGADGEVTARAHGPVQNGTLVRAGNRP